MSDQARTLGYVRASTRKQTESPEVQQETIGRYCAFNGLGEPTFFVDVAKSGKVPIQEREAGGAMFRALRRGDHVIVSKLDRAFRRLADCVNVLEQLEGMGVKLHVTNLMGGAIDLSSPMGRFLIHVLAAFAELERAFISERTRAGLANKKRKHQPVSAYPGYGFTWQKRTEGGKVVRVRVEDPDERAVMREIVAWRNERGKTWEAIADHLTRTLGLKTKDGGVWDTNRVRRAFRAELQLQLQEQRCTAEGGNP